MKLRIVIFLFVFPSLAFAQKIIVDTVITKKTGIPVYENSPYVAFIGNAPASKELIYKAAKKALEGFLKNEYSVAIIEDKPESGIITGRKNFGVVSKGLYGKNVNPFSINWTIKVRDYGYYILLDNLKPFSVEDSGSYTYEPLNISYLPGVKKERIEYFWWRVYYTVRLMNVDLNAKLEAYLSDLMNETNN